MVSWGEKSNDGACSAQRMMLFLKVLAQAGQFIIRHNLRLEPAIHLAGAKALEDRLEFNAKGFPRPMVRMVTFNPGMAHAARAEGLPVGP